MQGKANVVDVVQGVYHRPQYAFLTVERAEANAKRQADVPHHATT
jgi:hypothetical protein